jgi:hypothetical protein
MRGRRNAVMFAMFMFSVTMVYVMASTTYGKEVITKVGDKVRITANPPPPPPSPPSPVYKPTPTYTPPPVKDPFPLLGTSAAPPPIPKWNLPKKNVYKDYGIKIAPPLLIGFTRSWPILLQTVVSYITAGWPPEQIYVVENTGVQQSNKKGKLSLQNPFYLNYASLRKLGVNIVQTPVLLTFAQLQNFFLNLAHEKEWPFYFWSHQDVLALSFEDGGPNHKPAYNETGYKSLYELALVELNETVSTDPRWAIRFFAYDHLALVNPEAYEDVGGWDTMIPYYITDCDMHSRLTMAGWTMKPASAGKISDVNTALDDLLALYRDPKHVPSFVDPNPPPPSTTPAIPPAKSKLRFLKRDTGPEAIELQPNFAPTIREAPPTLDDPLDYWRSLASISDAMDRYKQDRNRNTWQAGQRGGFGEPYYYPAQGIAQAIDIITEAGKEVYRNKWGHRDCNLIDGAGLNLWDQWLVEKDWHD